MTEPTPKRVTKLPHPPGIRVREDHLQHNFAGPVRELRRVYAGPGFVRVWYSDGTARVVPDSELGPRQ